MAFNKLILSIILILGLSALLFGFVAAQDEKVEVQEEQTQQQTQKTASETKLPPGLVVSSQEVRPTTLFPEYPDKNFPVGKVVDVLLGFANTGDDTYHVEYITGYLVSPLDFKYYVQNFTGFLYNVTIQGGEDSTILYRFRTDPKIEPRDFGVVIDVFYKNVLTNRTHLTTFFNDTINLVEVSEGFDPRNFFAYVAILGMIALASFGVYLAFGDRLGLKSRIFEQISKTAATVGVTNNAVPTETTVTSGDDNSWLAPHLRSFKDRKNKGAKKTKKSLSD